jgi:hypothetical protein
MAFLGVTNFFPSLRFGSGVDRFSENENLNREHSFYGGVVVLAHLLFGGTAFLILISAIERYTEDGGWSLACLFRMAAALALFGYYWHSVHAVMGVFYALDLWEQSLLRRRSEDELIRAYLSG